MCHRMQERGPQRTPKSAPGKKEMALSLMSGGGEAQRREGGGKGEERGVRRRDAEMEGSRGERCRTTRMQGGGDGGMVGVTGKAGMRDDSVNRAGRQNTELQRRGQRDTGCRFERWKEERSRVEESRCREVTSGDPGIRDVGVWGDGCKTESCRAEVCSNGRGGRVREAALKIQVLS